MVLPLQECHFKLVYLEDLPYLLRIVFSIGLAVLLRIFLDFFAKQNLNACNYKT